MFVNCSDTTNLANCIRILPISSVVSDLNNPEMINAQTPGGVAELSGGRKGILLFNNWNTWHMIANNSEEDRLVSYYTLSIDHMNIDN